MRGLLLFLARTIDRATQASGRTLAYSLIPLVIIIVHGAFMRYAIKNMPSWTYEVSIFMYGIFVMGGGALCLKDNKHVSVDIIKNKLPPQVRRKFDLTFYVLIMTSMSILFFYSIPWVWDSFLIRERSIHQTTFNPQIWWFKMFIPISILGVILQALSNLIRIAK